MPTQMRMRIKQIVQEHVAFWCEKLGGEVTYVRPFHIIAVFFNICSDNKEVFFTLSTTVWSGEGLQVLDERRQGNVQLLIDFVIGHNSDYKACVEEIFTLN
ncbi:unnamed protein product [Ceratitis capitata]|uniref:(Mediterranean fruit fly) hypothetical protein n=1 Tax=Ceratitis capitata TaxID=7213 RepID=A0A811ULU7_CERCA|nr:unnamed protein product [Ceratitis capitata]